MKGVTFLLLIGILSTINGTEIDDEVEDVESKNLDKRGIDQQLAQINAAGIPVNVI